MAPKHAQPLDVIDLQPRGEPHAVQAHGAAAPLVTIVHPACVRR